VGNVVPTSTIAPTTSGHSLHTPQPSGSTVQKPMLSVQSPTSTSGPSSPFVGSSGSGKAPARPVASKASSSSVKGSSKIPKLSPLVTTQPLPPAPARHVLRQYEWSDSTADKTVFRLDNDTDVDLFFILKSGSIVVWEKSFASVSHEVSPKRLTFREDTVKILVAGQNVKFGESSSSGQGLCIAAEIPSSSS